MKLIYIKLFAFFLSLWFVLGCQEQKKPLIGDSEFQRRLNAEFKDASKSPLKDRDRKNFNGLDFFSIDSNYVVVAELERTPDSPWFKMKTTTERYSNERVFGIARFNLKGQKYQLNIYQGAESLLTEETKDYLFLPFLDDTNGESTYGGGRYIDLKNTNADSITIDFNKAYSPYCAYNEKFSCPIVPRENYLPIKIEAGVKRFRE